MAAASASVEASGIPRSRRITREIPSWVPPTNRLKLSIRSLSVDRIHLSPIETIAYMNGLAIAGSTQLSSKTYPQISKEVVTWLNRAEQDSRLRSILPALKQKAGTFRLFYLLSELLGKQRPQLSQPSRSWLTRECHRPQSMLHLSLVRQSIKWQL